MTAGIGGVDRGYIGQGALLFALIVAALAVMQGLMPALLAAAIGAAVGPVLIRIRPSATSPITCTRSST